MVYRVPGDLPRVEIARAFFRAWPQLPFQGAGDVTRTIAFDDGWLVAMANAYDHGFATCYPAGSRLLLDALEGALARSSGTSAERAREAFEAAARAFVEAEPPSPRDEDFPDEAVTASLTVALVRPDEVRCWYRGGEVVVLVDTRGVARRLPVHDLAGRFHAHHLASAPSTSPDILVETISRDDHRADEAAWAVQPGCSVWVLSNGLRRVGGDALIRPEWPTHADLDALVGSGHATYGAGVRLDIF